MHAFATPQILSRPPASGISVHPCRQPRAGLGLGRRDWPRPATSTDGLCTDHPALVSHQEPVCNHDACDGSACDGNVRARRVCSWLLSRVCCPRFKSCNAAAGMAALLACLSKHMPGAQSKGARHPTAGVD
eukprot:366270-Chlamydomonas_euryale.AAC.5